MEDNKKPTKIEDIKQRTLEIYYSMPQKKELRMKCFKERDEIIEINHKFFGYVASHTFINNPSVTYEDKLQSALMHFCECFWWYQWDGDETHPAYRKDISFTVFYKPRIGEMIERELNEVKYSVRRSLCMEAGEQLGKHWGKVTYDDLKSVKLPADKMNSLKAIFGSLYIADLSEHELYIEAPKLRFSEFENPTDMYNSIHELLIHDMIIQETKLTESELQKMSNMYGIDIKILRHELPFAEMDLHQRLLESMELQDID